VRSGVVLSNPILNVKGPEAVIGPPSTDKSNPLGKLKVIKMGDASVLRTVRITTRANALNIMFLGRL
jgi:hypothetical protein